MTSQLKKRSDVVVGMTVASRPELADFQGTATVVAISPKGGTITVRLADGTETNLFWRRLCRAL